MALKKLLIAAFLTALPLVVLGVVFWQGSAPSFELATADSSVEINPVSYSPSGPEGGVIIPASCPSNEHTPGECCQPGFGSSCTSSANACGQTNTGTIPCSGGCSVSTPPNPSGYGNSCTSSPNVCGQTNSGTIQCNGSCSASTPPNSNCSYTLSVSKTGNGSGTVTSSPGGINCGGTCSAAYSYGNSVTLSAAPSTGSSFAGWSGACSGSGGCSVLMTSDKSVTATFNNNPPSAGNLSVSQPDYCASGPAAFFSWSFQDSGDSQSAYRVQVDNNSGFSSPEDDSGKVGSGSQNYATPIGKLSYGNTYFWRLMVWDSIDQSSSWISGSSFATPAHAYPEINFTWTPSAPAQQEQTQFTDQSQVFGGSTKSAWSWTFQSGDPSSSTQQNPITKFTSPGSKTITLRVTDSSGFSCQGSKTLQAQLPLPEWEEIAPF